MYTSTTTSSLFVAQVHNLQKPSSVYCQ